MKLRLRKPWLVFRNAVGSADVSRRTLSAASISERQGHLLYRTLWVMCCMLLASGPVWGAPAKSIAEFVKLKSQWKRYADVKTGFRLEGRHSTLAPTAMRFRNCDLTFVTKSGQTFPKNISKSRSVEVQGNMGYQRGKMVFFVEKWTVLLGDEFRVRQQMRQFVDTDYQKMYALGQWTSRRAKFYSDQKLDELAATIFRQGVRSERRQMKRNDALGLYQLAERIQTLQLGEDLRLELVHEALWIQRRTSRDQLVVRRSIRERLDGAETPLRPALPKLQDRYLRDPIQVYVGTPASERAKLHRILYYDVEREIIESRARADKSNGKQIAAELEQRAPELHALAEKYVDGELNYRLRAIPEADRNSMLELSEEFRKRNQLQKSRDVMRSWIESRETEWRKAGPSGLIRLADEYRQLMEDRETAVALLKQAYDQTKGAEEVEKKLNQLGVFRSGKQWSTTRQPRRKPEDNATSDAGQGLVRVGMTRQQVIAALGQPDVRIRIVATDEINEIWNYSQMASSGISIQFVHRLRQISSVARVSSFSDGTAP